MLSRKIFHFISKFSIIIDRKNEFNAVLLSQLKVIFAKGWRDMHNTRSLFFRDEFTSENPKGSNIFSRCEIREEGNICFSDQIFSLKRREHFNLFFFFKESVQRRFSTKN